MIKFAKVVDEILGLCDVGMGTDSEAYKLMDMEELEVEQGYDGRWYIADRLPEKPAPTNEEQRQARAAEYARQVDPITLEITRLRDEEGHEAEIESLIAERTKKVAEIKDQYPYNV